MRQKTTEKPNPKKNRKFNQKVQVSIKQNFLMKKFTEKWQFLTKVKIQSKSEDFYQKKFVCNQKVEIFMNKISFKRNFLKKNLIKNGQFYQKSEKFC